LHVVELSPLAIRKALLRNARATKVDVAAWLVRTEFPQLRPLLLHRPSRPALWLGPRDRYWLHMFDALALALVARNGSLPRPEATDNLIAHGERIQRSYSLRLEKPISHFGSPGFTIFNSK
jgi:hypothetical protein